MLLNLDSVGFVSVFKAECLKDTVLHEASGRAAFVVITYKEIVSGAVKDPTAVAYSDSCGVAVDYASALRAPAEGSSSQPVLSPRIRWIGADRKHGWHDVMTETPFYQWLSAQQAAGVRIGHFKASSVITEFICELGYNPTVHYIGEDTRLVLRHIHDFFCIMSR